MRPSATSAKELGGCEGQPSTTPAVSDGKQGIRLWAMKKAGLAPRRYEKKGFCKARHLPLPIQRTSPNLFTGEIWVFWINSNLLIFRLPAPCCKLVYSPASPTPPWVSSLEVTWDTVSQAQVLTFPLNKNSQVLGYAYFLWVNISNTTSPRLLTVLKSIVVVIFHLL